MSHLRILLIKILKYIDTRKNTRKKSEKSYIYFRIILQYFAKGIFKEKLTRLKYQEKFERQKRSLTLVFQLTCFKVSPVNSVYCRSGDFDEQFAEWITARKNAAVQGCCKPRFLTSRQRRSPADAFPRKEIVRNVEIAN